MDVGLDHNRAVARLNGCLLLNGCGSSSYAYVREKQM